MMTSSSPASSVPYSGIWPALLTPLDDKLKIDVPTFAKHATSLIAAGCTGVTPFGTTGEGPSFTLAERRSALFGLIKGGVPPRRIMLSTSCAALPDVLALTRHAVDVEVFACLMLPPFFLKGVPDQGIIDAYRWVIDKVADSRLRIVLYHIPQVSGVALSHHVVQTLKDLYPDTIIGIKDSGCQLADSLAFAKAFMPPMQVWVGNEPDIPTMALHGTQGSVSGVANVLPHLLARLVKEPAGPNAARDLQRVKDFVALLVDGYGMTAAFKGVMAILTGNDGWRRVRPPLAALNQAEFDRLKKHMAVFALDRAHD